MSSVIVPAQERRLMSADPLDSGGVLRIDTSLGLDAFPGSRTLADARLLLAALAEQPAKATAEMKNLNRKFVARMVAEMTWPPGYTEIFLDRRVLDEMDVSRLYVLRNLMEVAGLVNRRKGAFHATRLGKRLLSPACAGELFGLLLRSYLGRLNWAFVGFGPEDRDMQAHCVHALWSVRHIASEGATTDEIAPRIVSDPTIWGRLARFPGGPDALPRAVQRRLLEPLWDFGLLAREPEDPEQGEGPPRWRVTPLFDSAVAFDLALAPTADPVSPDDAVVALKITLSGTTPPVWRRLEVPASLTLEQLHAVLNTAMGWLDYHLHAYEIEGRRYADGADSWDDLDDTLPEADIVLGDLFRAGVRRFTYDYDFGHGWQHEVAVESLGQPVSGAL
ncbi:MAG: hypothetical protein C0418_02680, partial [Coriobacteriaceae bacterium]|nr:hypothetical protein [Coriobacteriaceae bacterium]